MKRVNLDLSTVVDWESFHDLFISSFGFPDYYGRNMDAWIDCIEDFAIDDGVLLLNLLGMAELIARCPNIHAAINECSAFINYRSVESGGTARIALSFSS
jgi:hypothetical protein